MVRSASGESSYFTTHLPQGDFLWTAGFFNERFPDVVSPLGWSVVRRLIEPTAFREPLSFIGYSLPADFPLTKLYQGHVYTNVEVFQRLYRIFPEGAIPRDAGRRYFPEGDLSRRRAVPPPNPVRFLVAAAETLLTESAWHSFNYAVWQRFVPEFDSEVTGCLRKIEVEDSPPALLQQVDRLMGASLSLLRLHRWSLTYADVFYELLRRLVALSVDAGRATEFTAELIGGLSNKSTETDRALWRLVEQAAELDEHQLNDLRAENFAAFYNGLGASPAGRCFRRAFDDFLADYGHRSASLDIQHPAYAEEPAQALAVIARLLDAEVDPAARERVQQDCRRAAVRRVQQKLHGSPVRWAIFKLLLCFTHRYTVLRENQRFYWQKSMHAKRRAFLRIGQSLAADNLLSDEEDVFFLTLSEVAGVVRGWLSVPEIRDLVTKRQAEFEALQGTAYPAFLRGQSPLSEAGFAGEEKAKQLAGLAASPGRVRGPALVVSGPAALNEAWQRLSSDKILVTGSTDPAWTPLFLRVSGLVMERGGQLSHGAVVAREYGLPAVVGVAGALDHIGEGQLIEVDGGTGTVRLLSAAR